MDKAPFGRRVASVGTYDGLHRGHLCIIDTLRRIASLRGLEPLVITFDSHPRHTIDPDSAPDLLMQPGERDRMLRRWDMRVLTIEFTPEYASMTAEEWLRLMHDEQRVDILVLGHDNKFGADGRFKTISDYKELGLRIGVEVVEAPVEDGISSTAIRCLVREGKVAEAAELLGHPFVLTGEVEPGKHLGASIGFPTANIRPLPHSIVPGPGVYSVEVEIPSMRESDSGALMPLPGVCNIGWQPSVVNNAPLRIEVHIIGYTRHDESESLYGKTLRVGFIRRLRDERKFDTIEALRAQIKEDIKAAYPWK